MWEIPKYRIRAYLRSVENTRKQKKKAVSRDGIHLKRVHVELRSGDGFTGPTTIITARAVLNDMSLLGLKVFTSMPLNPGMELAITIEHPRYFYVRGVVRYCHEVNYESRILSSNPFNHRVYIQFIFNSAAEEIAVESYCRQIMAEHVVTRPIRAS
jgi:hypothetical protein